MRVLILTGKREAFSVGRLESAFRSAGHDVLVLDPFACCISFDHARGAVLHDGQPLVVDSVVPRMSARSATPYTVAIVRQLEAQGAFALNGAQSIELARDKLKALQTLARSSVPVPRTLVLANRKQLLALLPDIGGLPAVVKLLHGTQGVGVMLAESEDALRTLMDTLWRMREDTLVQRFVRESRGRDVRAFVVGGRVVAAMRRIAQGSEFRANLHQGGTAERVDLDAASNETARRAASALGLGVAGVDLLEANEGALVLEVNSSPSLEGIERASGVDIAREIRVYAESMSSSRGAP